MDTLSHKPMVPPQAEARRSILFTLIAVLCLLSLGVGTLGVLTLLGVISPVASSPQPREKLEVESNIPFGPALTPQERREVLQQRLARIDGQLYRLGQRQKTLLAAFEKEKLRAPTGNGSAANLDLYRFLLEDLEQRKVDLEVDKDYYAKKLAGS